MVLKGNEGNIGQGKQILARHVSEVGMGELRRQLDYKSSWSQRRLVVTNR